MKTPDNHNVIEIKNNKYILDYLSIIRKHHIVMNMLDTGVFDKEKVLSTPLNSRLYVAPSFSESYIDAQTSRENWSELVQLEVLFEQKRLFILGDPGIGKTTLFNRISTIFSDYNNIKLTEKYGQPIPFPITLRDLDFSKIKTWKDLIKQYFLQNKFTENNFKYDSKLISSVFKSGQAFVMLDGLDEITDKSTRNKLSKIIQKGIYQYQDARWWISSRIIGFSPYDFWGLYEKDEIIIEILDEDGNIKETLNTNLTSKNFFSSSKVLKEFKQYYITPFTNEQIQNFMLLWFDFYEPREELRNEFSNHFFETLQTHTDVFHLARIPNLLAMMALYYRVNEKFPDGRHELYRKISEMYLQILYDKRGIKLDKMLTLDEEKKCLSALAYEMQERRGDKERAHLTITEKDAKQIFINTLNKNNEPNKQINDNVDAYFNVLNKNSAVLIPRAEKEYGFLHLSYQEYFAAEELRIRFESVTSSWSDRKSENDFWKEMQFIAKQYKWKETLVLFFESFMSSWNKRIEACRYAFEKTFEWNKNTQKIPRKYYNLVEEILTDSRISSPDWDSSIGRVAPLFSKDEQLSILTDIFIDNEHNNIIDWGKENNIYLELNNNTIIPKINNYYWVGNNNTEVTLNNLEFLTNCRYLALTNANIKSISFVKKMPNLQMLELQDNKIVDITSLSSLKKLKHLDISSNKITSIDALLKLKNIDYLDMSFNKITDIKPLISLNKIKYLYLTDNQLKEINVLSKLNELRLLKLEMNKIENIKPLSGLKKLMILDLSNNKISHLKKLSEVDSLFSINLSNNNIKDINNLSFLTQLGILYLSQNQITNIEVLSKLSELGYLDLSQNQITNIEVLSKLSGLKFLDLSQNQIKEIIVLTELKSLKELTLDGNAIVDTKSIKILKKKGVEVTL